VDSVGLSDEKIVLMDEFRVSGGRRVAVFLLRRASDHRVTIAGVWIFMQERTSFTVGRIFFEAVKELLSWLHERFVFMWNGCRDR
jgi:hypothetical protein